MQDVHVKTVHSGTEHIIAEARQRYWPISARRVAKQAIRKCMKCRKQHVKPAVPKMADLSSERFSQSLYSFRS